MPLPLLFALLHGSASLTVANVEAGETIRHPLLLLQGQTKATRVIAGRDWKAMTEFPAADGHYAAAVELKPGPNMVLVSTGGETVKLRVEYKPMTTPYRVRVAYLLAKDEGTDHEGPPDADRTLYKERLDTALKMMQGVVAEGMREAGHGPRTFPLEFGPDGKVVVHLVRTDLTGAELRKLDGNALWSRFHDELSRRFDYGVDKVCGVMAFTRYDGTTRTAAAHTALGGGGLGLFGGGTLWSFPFSVGDIPRAFADDRPVDPRVEFDDSGLRSALWAEPATGIGAMLHEMGHTFGLPHSPDPRSTMSRGFDQFNRRFVAFEPPRRGEAAGHPVGPDSATHWDAHEAYRLALSPWFRPDGKRLPTEKPPTVRVDGETVAVESPYGLRLVWTTRGGNTDAFVKYAGEKSARLKRSDLGTGETVIVVDAYGNQAEARLAP